MADHGIAYVPPPPCIDTALPLLDGYPKGSLMKREPLWVHVSKRAMVVRSEYLDVDNIEVWVSFNRRTWVLEGAYAPLAVPLLAATIYADSIVGSIVGCHPHVAPYGFECGCGRLYMSYDDIAELPDCKVGPVSDDPEEAPYIWEQRLCRCGSHRLWPVSTLAWRQAWETMVDRLTRQSTRGFPPKVSP